MVNKQGNFIEQHIEKAVLVIAVIAAVVILFMYVFRSPYVFEFDKRQFRPGQIDIYVAEQTEQLKQRLYSEPVTKEAYEPKSVQFLAKMESAVSVSGDIFWPVPSSVDVAIEKKYPIPSVGDVNNAAVEHIRAAAYVPVEEITTANVSNEDAYKPDDLDLVTVQASFSVGGLADSFEQCFSGSQIPEDWRDSVLARPVFAAVELQRQQLGEDGQWGDWQDIGRTKVDPRKDEFVVAEDAGSLASGGVLVRLLRFSDTKVQSALLQPEPYRIASAEEQWYPPVLHKKYLAYQHEKEMRQRREAIAAQLEEQASEREKSRPDRDRRTRTPRAGGSTESRGGEPDIYSRTTGRGAGSAGSRSPTRQVRTERDRRSEPASVESLPRPDQIDREAAIQDEMRDMLLLDKNVSELREPIVFWAYDDTVEPGSSYRYRIRLGVFNPVAGTGQVAPEASAYANRVVLWSGYSDVTDAVSIPARTYFFAVNVQEAAKAVVVQVCRYVLGYWYSEQFMVKRGEEIGREIKLEPKPDEEPRDITLPEHIDYATGAMVVDVVAVNDWSGGKNLQERHYYDMLYSFDGLSIMRVAAKLLYWPEELRVRYNEIKTLEKRERQPLRSWASAGGFQLRRDFRSFPRDRRGETAPGMERMPEDMYYRMMMEGRERGN